ncbi:aminotransferase class I/II-fold pyridoxal phosphate-dependent enzyme [bacterium]|nr:aminotransferase class I/II-fold pyridoxal phosphate-dependent enzyme [bacterium]
MPFDDTILLHGGHRPDGDTNSRAVPIYQTTSYTFHDTDHAARLFGLQEFGNIYTRLMNPTTDVLEKRLAQLEGGVGALALASGQSAITYAILTIAQAGDHVVSFSNLYGGTHTLFQHTLPRFGVTVSMVPTGDMVALEAAITPQTKAIYAESLGNPQLNVTDLEAISAIAQRHQIPFILDNTLTPYLLKPFQHGVSIMVYSTTKYISGHGVALGGAVIDSGTFDWKTKKNGVYHFPLIADPNPSYHGLDIVEALAPIGNIGYITNMRISLLRDTGAAISPFNSFLTLQGMETLHLRMARHAENALKVATFLEQHPKIKWVNYPGLSHHPDHHLCGRYLPKGAGGIVGIGLHGGLEAGKRLVNGLTLFSHLANVGDAKSLVIHPASTTHQQLSERDQRACGVSPDYVRLSVGIEAIDDIVSDLETALKGV